MAKLYVVGNGFDLWHGLPTGYKDFYAFAKEILDELENYYSFELTQTEPWCDFENSLGHFSWQRFYDDYNDTDVTSESFKMSEVYGLEDELSQEAENHVEQIRNSFQEWVKEIDVSAAKKQLIFPQDARFLTFNYTSTLQNLYGISNELVFHVHGRAETSDELIFGHGETIDEEPELDDKGDSNRTVFSDAEGAAKIPFYSFRKPVEDVLERYRTFFDSVHNVSEIIVIGHSLSKIDLPYFRRLVASNPCAQWLVCCYRSEDHVHHSAKLVECGVQRELIRMCTYEDL